MSVVSDDLFADKLKQVQALKEEINQDRVGVYQILGEWLAHALTDDNHTELQKTFIAEHENPKYVRLKKDQRLLASIVENMEIKFKVSVAKSDFTPPKSNNRAENTEHSEAANLENNPSVRDYGNKRTVSVADNHPNLDTAQNPLSFDNNQTDRSSF